MKKKGYVIVGAGMCGSVIARILADHGHHVEIVESRHHIGGNCYDFKVDNTLVHLYGPHYFRTNSTHVLKFIQRFSEWIPWGPKIGVVGQDGSFSDWPLEKPDTPGGNFHEPKSFREKCLNTLSVDQYNNYVRNYTYKQWGEHGQYLSPDLAKRIPVRKPGAPYQFQPDKLEMMPKKGYTEFFNRMLEGIPLHLNSSAFVGKSGNYIWTGNIEKLVSGVKLPYVGNLRIIYTNSNEPAQDDYCQINDAQQNSHTIRTIYWSNLPYWSQRNVITREYPGGLEPEYPMQTQEARKLYKEATQDVPENVILCGRLADFRYYDMDQAILRAMKVAEDILEGKIG